LILINFIVEAEFHSKKDGESPINISNLLEPKAKPKTMRVRCKNM